MTARSVRPSLLKSAATMDVAPLPGGKATVKGCWNVPSPLPGRMVTLSEPWLTTATPRLPLPVKSPVATAAVVVADRVGGRFLERAVALAQEHGDVGGADVSRGQVKAAVAVEIARHEIDRGRPCRHAVGVDHAAACRRTVDGGLKRPVAVAQEHRDIVGVGVGDGQVEMAVAEVARHDRGGVRPDGERRHRLGWNVPSPLPFRISTTLVARVGHGQVEVTGAEVARHDRCRSAAREARWFAWRRNSRRPDWTGW